MKDGGPAFAVYVPERTDRSMESGVAGIMVSHRPEHTQLGMSLRDYFAAAALNKLTFMVNGDNPVWADLYKAHAKVAYEIADAMIAERDKP